MDRLQKEIQQLKGSFDDCDFESSDIKRLFEIIEEQQQEIKKLQNRKDEVLLESGKRWTKLIKIQQILDEK